MRVSKKTQTGIFLLILSLAVQSQTPLSMVQLRTVKGSPVSFGELTKKDSLVLVCFWASWSEPSIQELNAINSVYQRWKSIPSLKLIAVSVDEGKSSNKIKPLVNMNGWMFEVYSDPEGELRKALNSKNLPQAMIIKGDKVIYQQSGFEPGTEKYLFQKIQAISEGRH